MTAVLLTVGDEILIGQIVNTNAAWLGEKLGGVGVDVVRAETVGDDATAIRDAILRAMAEADVTIVTGGLGPTHDDITKGAVAEAFGVPLRFDAGVLAGVEAKFAARGRPFPPGNHVLADVPEGFEVLDNPVGTAPGLWGERAPANERKAVVVVLPGVPVEMKAIMEASVFPRLRVRAAGHAVVHRTILTVGEGESNLAQLLGPIEDLLGAETAGSAVRLAFLPAAGTVRLRLSGRGSDRAAVEAAVARAAETVRERLAEYVFGEGETTLEEAVGALLGERALTLGVAESCTGGALAARLTASAGASRFFMGSVVAYANPVKTSVLGVDPDVLHAHGAVSEAVVRQMAAGAREVLGSGVALATTGIAGPGGGTAEKPVGLVWLGWADADGTHAVRLHLLRDRALNVALASTAALNLARRQLLRR